MKAIIGKKLGMSQLFSESGDLMSVTIIEVQPNLIVEVKNVEKHKYSAVVIGYQETRPSLLNKAELGRFKAKGIPNRKKLIEIKGIETEALKVGEFLKLEDNFQIGNFVDVQGCSRGHGFTGATKLWNFATGPKSHGAGYPHRYQGSLESGRGGSAAQKVWKGKKMSGRYGNETVSMLNLEVIHLDKENNLLFIKGSIPGRKNRIVRIKTTTRKNKITATPFKLLINEKN